MEINLKQTAVDPTIKVLANKCKEYETKYGTKTIVLLEMGNTYEAYNDSAELLHTSCEFPIIYYGDIPYIDFQKECDFWVFPRMIRAGFKFCIIQPGA